MLKNTSILLIILAAVMVLCCCTIIVLSGAFISILKIDNLLPTLVVNLPITLDTPTPTPFEITRQPVDEIPVETLKLLEEIEVPENDLAALACRFKGVCNIPMTVSSPSKPKVVGDHQAFWVSNEDTNSYFQVQATLQYITPHSYFWVAEDVSYDEDDMRRLMDNFETEIYPTNREFFGSEWSPGVDNDEHIYILYTGGLGGNVAGYYTSLDQFPTQVFQNSNVHEMFYISSSESLSRAYTYSTLAHELQHMIHWYQDRNESSFLNEGFSELAVFINNYKTGGFDQVYLSSPDVNLTDWLGGSAYNSEHYGASFLFATYFLDRFGDDATKALVHNQKNGLDSIDETLGLMNITDPSTGKSISADDFFLDWVITNIIQDGSVGDGRYVYHNYPDAPTAQPRESISTCPVDPATRTVNQYGVDYILFNCPGQYSLHFEGATSTRLVPADPHSGSYAFWSNEGDESDMTLTRAFDLTGISGPISIDYWAWYDIENDFDYVYVEASTDGQQWEILNTPSGTATNPNGTSYGWGYTGQSNSWIHETVDLSEYAGQNVYVRFEYLTDQAVNTEGFLLDDVTIQAANYSCDFENDDGGWQAAGFARIANFIPQTFRLALITHTSSGAAVQIIPVNTDQTADIPLSIGQNGVQDVVLVVTGTTRATRVIAPYRFSIR